MSNKLPKVLSWAESQNYHKQIKDYGLKQGLNVWFKHKDSYKKNSQLGWGEEIEYEVGKLDHKNKKAKVHLEGFQKAMELLSDKDKEAYNFEEEFSSWMLEAIPKNPYTIWDVNGPHKALKSLIGRRQLVNERLKEEDLFVFSQSYFPMIGVKRFFESQKHFMAKLGEDGNEN